ncbi:MAG: Sjogren's syndrome/scleroderma autoantigen 1 family protein [Halolamina sp.]
MSEEFDKEAEREKLREKLEKDEQKRQETQRMSELLLQGATMTNEHCDSCGDPLFRDGECTFCPTCGGGAAQQAAEGAQSAEAQQPAEPPEGAGDREPSERGQSEPVQPAASEPTHAPTPTGQAGPLGDASVPDATSTTGDGPRAELQRAVTRSARKANKATDPRTATQWLEAAKAAAEALDALEK